MINIRQSKHGNSDSHKAALIRRTNVTCILAAAEPDVSFAAESLTATSSVRGGV